jgi:hypothetical protein
MSAIPRRVGRGAGLRSAWRWTRATVVPCGRSAARAFPVQHTYKLRT